MPPIELFRVSGYCRAIATAAPTYSLNDACAGPANLSASTSPLDVRSRRSRSSPVWQRKIDFHDFSRALTDAQVELAQREFTPARPLRSARQLGIGGLVHVPHPARAQVHGDLVMCELSSDHYVTEICVRSLSNTLQITHVFERGVSTVEKPGDWRLLSVNV